MSYRQKIEELMWDENENALTEWIETQPVLEQTDILKEVKTVMQQLLAEIDDNSQKETLEELDKKIDAYQETILDEQLASLKYDLAVKERDKAFAKMDEAVAGIREYVKECVTTNAPNAKEMKELAFKMIELEKDNGTYDPANWDWLE